MKKIFLSPFILLGFIFGTFFSFYIPKSQLLNYKKTPSPTVVTIKTYGIPLRITIPAINVDTVVEHVGKDAQGNMDVPKDANNVAWYELGYQPGENGNAVIAGHLDTKTGPAIFYNLNQLKVGDEITVATDLNKKLVFTVVNKQIYKANNFPVLTVFGPASEPLLNLITCTGVFDRTTEHYLDRVVVITKLKNIL